MRFADITGHGELKATLARAVDEGRVSHAQLFTGRSGYGTLPLALAWAQYLNCTDRRGGDSCGVCPSCLKTAALEHPDLHFAFPVNSSSKGSGAKKPVSDMFLPRWRELWRATGGLFDEQMWYSAIDMENQQGIVSRAEADEIVRKLSFKSFEARYKVMIVWLPERMRPEAANSLLKLLEEPWDRTVFLLVSAAPQTLLPTIVSRTQHVAVPGVDEAQVGAMLAESYSLSPGDARRIAHLAAGDLIDAAKLATAGEGGDAKYFELFVQLMRLSYNDRHLELFEWAEQAAALGREEQKALLAYTARMVRESYMTNAGLAGITYLWGDELKFCTNFAPYIGNHNVEQLVAEIERAVAHVGQNGHPRIVFPHFALTVSKLINKI